MQEKVFWTNPGYVPAEPLRADTEAQFVIIGGGIAGLSAAYFLLQEGVPGADVVLLESDVVGSGSTGHSAGMIIPEPENHESAWWGPLIERYGLPLIKAYRERHLNAFSTIENLIQGAGIERDARRGDLLILARDKEGRAFVERDLRAREMLGESPQQLEGVPLLQELKSPWFIFADRTLEGLSVNPVGLVQGIAVHLRTLGVRIHEHSYVTVVESGRVKTQGGSVVAQHVIRAQGMGERHGDLLKFVTTVTVSEPLDGATLEALELKDRDMFIDEKPGEYCYYGKLTGDDRLLVGYGDGETDATTSATSLKTGDVEKIEQYLRSAFPDTPIKLAYAWSAGYVLTSGVVPMISIDDGVTVVNGAGTQLGSMVAAEYAVHKILGKPHSLDALWDNVYYTHV